MTRSDINDDNLKNMMMSVKNTHQRCIYENDDILIEHAFSEFPSGDKEAVMMVSLKKDGLIWRTETGATPIK